jgi:hypothetical protein
MFYFTQSNKEYKVTTILTLFALFSLFILKKYNYNINVASFVFFVSLCETHTKISLQ